MIFSFINWEKSWTWLMPVNLYDQRVYHPRFTYVYTCVYAKRAKHTMRSWVLAQLVYALPAGHKRYWWPASVQSEHPFIASMYENELILAYHNYWIWLNYHYYLSNKTIFVTQWLPPPDFQNEPWMMFILVPIFSKVSYV